MDRTLGATALFAAAACIAGAFFVACGTTSDQAGGVAEADGGVEPGADGSTTGGDGGTSDGGGQDGGSAGPPTSCTDKSLPALSKCGPSANQDCCASNVVSGGKFNLEGSPNATVSTFKLDVYEVTVGRFRTFVDAGQGTTQKAPKTGAGAHPLIPNSGWLFEFNQYLAGDTPGLKTQLYLCPPYDIWTNQPAANETRALNCVSFIEAFAFCIWDGGRLPTEAEWNYAAAGGSEQREYPWGAGIDATRANYNLMDPLRSGDRIAI